MTSKTSIWKRRLLAAFLLPLLVICLSIIKVEPTFAARGGRVGGGSFRVPSMPRSSGRNYSGRSGYRSGFGGGFGFPFIIPFFGFGGGGLFGLLAMMAIAGFLVNSLRGSSAPSLISNSRETTPIVPKKINLIQIQVGLLASAKQLQGDLRAVASSADTSSPAGLQRVLQETTLALLRQPDLWVYANIESGQVPFDSAESTFNRLSISERSKLDAEITSNVDGQLLTNSSNNVGYADATSEFIVVTLLTASKTSINLKGAATGENLRDSLRILGSSSSSDLMALEVIWQPEGSGDVLSTEELLTAYPNLQHL